MAEDRTHCNGKCCEPAVRLLVAVAAAALFWIVVLPRTTLPSWQLAVIPASLAGAALGWRDPSRRRTRLFILVAFVGTLSAVFGELAQATIDLRRSLKKQDQSYSELDLRRFLQSKTPSASTEETKPTPPGKHESTSSADADSLSTGWFSLMKVASVIYWESIRHHYLGLAASLCLSLFGATQSARIVLCPEAEE